MDHRASFEMIDAAVFDMENSICDELMQMLNQMERDYNCKQIKTFLKRSGFSGDVATKTANKLNEARRVYPRLENVVENYSSCPNVDSPFRLVQLSLSESNSACKHHVQYTLFFL